VEKRGVLNNCGGGDRWYGEGEPKVAFVERKTHRESWKGEESVKERFTLPEDKVVPFLTGKYKLDQAVADLRKKVASFLYSRAHISMCLQECAGAPPPPNTHTHTQVCVRAACVCGEQDKKWEPADQSMRHCPGCASDRAFICCTIMWFAGLNHLESASTEVIARLRWLLTFQMSDTISHSM
jgi:hypothetical protein